MSRREIRRGIRWCKANLSAAWIAKRRGFPFVVGPLRQVCSRVGARLVRRVPSVSPSGREERKCTLGPNSPQGESGWLDRAEGPPRGVPEAYIEGESDCDCCRTARLPQAPIPTGVDPAWEQLRQVCIETFWCCTATQRSLEAFRSAY